MKSKILILNGPNLNYLGKREPDIYGNESFIDYLNDIRNQYKDIDIKYFQNNIEGELINKLYEVNESKNYIGVVFNAGAYTHTSIALHDCIKAISIPVIEVHISNVAAREDYRKISYLSDVCKGTITGFGYDSYNGLKDLGIYENNEFWLDTELIKNETFNEKIFNPNKKTLSYIITYSAHMPYKTTKGTCPMLTDKQGLTEYECLKIQAKETDDMLNLILETLKEKNMMENTVLVLFSDHYVYTLENKSLLDEYKETDTNLINKTPFMIYHNGEIKKTVKNVNSQLDILPTILNLFGITYYPNNYIGRDILSNDYDPLVFFPDGSWYNGQTYVTNGEYYKGRKISDEKLQKYNSIVKRKMSLNDAVIKSDYFAKKTR